MPSNLDQGSIDVYMPAHPAALVLARLQVAALGSMLGLDVDAIADLRLATEELCLLVLAPPSPRRGRLHLTFEWGEAAIATWCVLEPEEDGPCVEAAEWDDTATSGLSSQILGALVDEHGAEGQPGALRAWFRKKRPAP
jgi:hypothetical protein